MKRPAETLTDAEVQALLKACSRRTPTGRRNRALLGLLYRSGLRIGEALALRPADLDRSQGSLRVLHGKGDKARTVGIDAGAVALVDEWLEMRPATANGAPLFCTLRGGPVAAGYVRNLMRRLRARAGIAKRVHAHGLRHTHAAQLAAEGTPVNVIQQQLGHSNVRTTSEYINHLRPGAVLAAIKERPKW